MRKLAFVFLWTQIACAEKVASRFFIELGAGANRMYTSVQGYSSSDVENPYVLRYPDINVGDPRIIPNPYFRNMSSQWGNFSPIGMLSLGYDYRPDPTGAFVGGLRLGGGYSGVSSESLYGVSNDSQTDSSSMRQKVLLSEKGFFLAAVRLGGVIDQEWMPFIEVGWTVRCLRARYNRFGVNMLPNQPLQVPPGNFSIGVQSQNIYHWVNALLVGVGLEWSFSSNFVVGALWEMAIGHRKSMSFSTNRFTLSNGAYDTPLVKVAPLMSQFFLTFKYILPAE